MTPPHLKLEEASRFLKRASFRLAECEAEIRALPLHGSPGRRRKLENRCDRYRDLMDDLRRVTSESEGPSEQEREKSVSELKEQILGATDTLTRSRKRVDELRSLWGEHSGLEEAHRLLRDFGL